MTSRISVLIVALAMVVGACSDSSGPKVVDLKDARIVKVAGDNQAEPVASTAPSNVIIPAGLTAQVGAPGDLFEEILVVRLAEEGKSSLSGASVKPGTMIHWEVRGEGCGKPVGGSTAVDDSAYSINRWRKGTKAGECLMDACRILASGAVECDETFTAVQEPGAPVKFANIDGLWSGIAVSPGDTLDARDLIRHGLDAHGNEIDPDLLRATVPGSLVRWWWYDRGTSHSGSFDWSIASSGWTIVVPDFAAKDYRPWDGQYGAGLYLWHADDRPGPHIAFTSPVE